MTGLDVQELRYQLEGYRYGPDKVSSAMNLAEVLASQGAVGDLVELLSARDREAEAWEFVDEADAESDSLESQLVELRSSIRQLAEDPDTDADTTAALLAILT